MTPPPMTTTCARSGFCVEDIGRLPLGSVTGRHFFEQPAERGAAELLHCVVVTLHGPFPEVEFQWAGTILDASPQRPAVLGDGALQPGPRDLVPQRTAVIGADEFFEPLDRQSAFAPDVAELEAG